MKRCPNRACGNDLSQWPPTLHMGEYWQCPWCGQEIDARTVFILRMKAAGWQRSPGPGFGWYHPATDTRWEGENYTTGQGVAWEYWNARGETPPTGVIQV